MPHTASDPYGRRAIVGFTALLLAVAPPVTADDHTAVRAWTGPPVQDAASIVSNRVTLSGDAAELVLELDDGRTLELALRDGRAVLDGEDMGSYRPGGELDESWRSLLDSLDGSIDQVAAALVAWSPPGDGVGERLDAALEAALGTGAGAAVSVAEVRATQDAASLADSLERLRQRLETLQREQERMDEADAGSAIDASFLSGLRSDIRNEVERELRREFRNRTRATGWFSPFRHIWRGLGGILSTLALYAVLVGIGFAVVFFGQQYLEGVADTARHYTVRSWLVGLAGSFLVLPAFVVGLLALTISIVGIPLVIVWVVAFPVALALALLLGYLGVGHAAGEALAERRFYGGEWFKRANSYYYVLTGTGLLLALFIVGSVVQMAGPWFGFIRGLVTFIAVVLTWAALTIGLGAVLLSRGGARAQTRVPGPSADPAMEETRV